MPTYNFICDNCGNEIEIHCPIKDRNNTQRCDCGKIMKRDYVGNGPNIGGDEYGKPLHSDSLAINPSQVAEHKREFPNVELDESCRPVFKNYRQHDSYLKKTGFVKQPQKIKPKGVKISGK